VSGLVSFVPLHFKGDAGLLLIQKGTKVRFLGSLGFLYQSVGPSLLNSVSTHRFRVMNSTNTSESVFPVNDQRTLYWVGLPI